MRGFQPAQASKAKAQYFANGGAVRGKGTGTSDEVPQAVPEGTYIMPADSTAAVGEQALAQAGQGSRGFSPGSGEKVPVNLSNGEFKLPPEQVHAIGVQALDQMKGATHTPVTARGFAPGTKQAQAGEPRMFFADGGVVGQKKDEELVGQIPTGGPKAPAPDGRGGDTELSRNVNNSLNAMGGMGVVSSVPLRQPPASRALTTAAPAAGFAPGALAKTGQLATGAAPQAAQAARGLPGTNAALQQGAQANAYAAAGRTLGGASAGATALDNNRPADPMAQPKVNSFGDAAAVARGASAALPSAGALSMGTAPQAAPQASPQVTTPEARKAVGLFPYSHPDAGANIYAGFGLGKSGEQQAAPNDSRRIDSLDRQIPGNGAAPAPAADGSQGGWRDTEFGRNVSNTMMALPGIGGLGRIAATGGAISTGLNAASTGINAASRMAALGAGVTARGFAPAAASAPASNPYASVTPEQGRDMAEINSKAQSPMAAAPSAEQQRGLPPARQPGDYDPNQSRPDLGYGPIGDRTKLTNEQAAIMNPAGRVTMTRGANGNMEFSGNNVSGQVSYNDASGKAFSGRGLPMPGGGSQGFANFSVAPAGADVATGPNGSYAYATSGSGVRGLRGQGSSAGSYSGRTADGIDVRGLRGPQADRYAAEVRQAQATNAAAGEHARTVQNRMDQEKNLRKLDIKASSAGSLIERMAAQKAYNAALAQDAGFRAGADAGSVARTQNEGATARERVQQAGATERVQMQEDGQNSRAGQTQELALSKLAMEQETQGFSSRAAAQQEQLRNVLLNPNATPEQRKVAQRSLAALSGKTAADRMQTVALPDTVDNGQVVRGGQALVRTLEDGTVEQVPIGAQGGEAMSGGTTNKFQAGQIYVDGQGRRAKFNGTGWEPA